MNDRIRKLRQESLNAVPSLSAERASLLTEFYAGRSVHSFSIPVQRAKAFMHIMEHKKICINDGELIVGERGPAPKAAPTYPEICVHSQEDLAILDKREKIPFKVSDEVKTLYNDKITDFWSGRSIRDRIFNALSPEWKKAYKAGIFTEFLEQRSPGHTVADDKIYKKGFTDFKLDIREAMADLDFHNDAEALDKRDELQAISIAADAIIRFANRHAEQLERLEVSEKDPERKAELHAMAEICRKVPEHAPETFWEALQYYWFVHLGVITEFSTWDSFNPGRLDQHLYPFYKRDIKNGVLTKERAKELLSAFWIKFNNQPAPPKVGVTAKESNTYTDFTLINVGGLTADGNDAVNELSYLILDVIEEMRILQPSSMVQISKKNPDKFLDRALGIVKTGFGQPSIFNTDTIIQELTLQGKSIEDARNGGASGCVEAGAFGKEAYILTGYFNLPKVLEVTLNNGTDPVSGELVGLETGDPETFKDFGDFMNAFRRQLEHFIDIKIEGNNIIERKYAKYLPSPFMSLLIDDCIKRGKDYHNGGARYNTSYIQGVGIGTVTDALSGINRHIYENNTLSISQLLDVLSGNFEGSEEIRQLFLNDTPRYGNDDDEADHITEDVFDIFYQAVNGRPNTKGGVHRINLLPTTVHIYFGEKTGALPDGRLAFTPISEGISPVQGSDRNGPTAVIKSAAKIDHTRTGGTLLNQKFTPSFFKDNAAIQKLRHLVRSYFKLDGHHIQFNVVDVDTLKKAQKDPMQYRDLIVRVAGYSDYFVDLTESLQEEIIRRTGHSDC